LYQDRTVMIMLDRITFTGADDTTDHEGLFALLDAYPLAEAGILLGNHEGSPRFPGLAWLEGLLEHCQEKESRLQRQRLSLHLCGRWTEMFLSSRLGSNCGLDALLARYKNVFGRLQLNTHGEIHSIRMPDLLHNLSFVADRCIEVIFQRDGVNDDLFDWVRWTMSQGRSHGHLKVSTLFDLSHGAGKQAAELQKPIQGVYCGYAGGFSPENIGENLRQIDELMAQHGTTTYWVDAETWLMSPDTHRLSLQRAGQYLEVASEHVTRYVRAEFERMRAT